MPTAKKPAKKPAKRAAPAGTVEVKNFEGKTQRQPEGIAFLMQQHRQVEADFKAYERATTDDEKQALASKICLALKVHTQIEEEILYPPAHEKLADEDLVDEAYVEHEGAKRLIADIEAMSPGDHCYDAKVKVLSEYIKHHVKEEETELFPKVEKALGAEALATLGESMEALFEVLQAQEVDVLLERSRRTGEDGARNAAA
jgi:hemerythrin-like domain-containing protein